MSERQFRVNEQIRVPQVRLIDENGKNRGVVPTKDALAYAESVGLDLVEVAPDARPPVCRVMNYSKFLYEQSKREREARKAQKQIEVKELRLRPKTDEHHIGFKLKQARKFIEKGHKVRIRVLFRGRERTHPELGQELLMKVAEELSDIALIDQKPVFEGRGMSMVLAPDTDKKKKKKK